MSEHIRMAAQASKKHFSIWVAQGTPDKLKIKKKKNSRGSTPETNQTDPSLSMLRVPRHQYLL
jgi:hypothetical protein